MLNLKKNKKNNNPAVRDFCRSPLHSGYSVITAAPYICFAKPIFTEKKTVRTEDNLDSL